MEITHEPLHLLLQINFGTVNVVDIPTSFIWIIMFDEAFKYGDGAKIRDYIGTNAEPFSVELCNFVPCRISENNFNSFLYSVRKLGGLVLCITSRFSVNFFRPTVHFVTGLRF
jgi:hypothetical protein